MSKVYVKYITLGSDRPASYKIISKVIEEKSLNGL